MTDINDFPSREEFPAYAAARSLGGEQGKQLYERGLIHAFYMVMELVGEAVDEGADMGPLLDKLSPVIRQAKERSSL